MQISNCKLSSISLNQKESDLETDVLTERTLNLFNNSTPKFPKAVRFFEEGECFDLNILFDPNEKLNRTIVQSALERQIVDDINILDDPKKIISEAQNLIEEEGLFNGNDKRIHLAKTAASIYAATYKHYAPCVIDWAQSLLETALSYNSPHRLVFMARDGIPPYKVAIMLKEKYPERYGSVPLSLVYLSRKVVKWGEANNENKEVVIEYMAQRGVKGKEPCTFVDIGFQGTMLPGIKKIMSAVLPEGNIQFTFFISHSSEVKGFLSDEQTKLNAIKYKEAGGNFAVHWLEDTHQGVLESTARLVKCPDGIIRPNSKVGLPEQPLEGETVKIEGKKPNGKIKYTKITCKEYAPKSYLYKRFGYKAIIDFAEKNIDLTPPITSVARPFKMLPEAKRVSLDEFLSKYPSDVSNGPDTIRYSLTKHM